MHEQIPAGMVGPDAVDLDVRAFLVGRPGGLLLIDTGMSADAHAIGDALGSVGADWGDLEGVVLTHAHPDHVGGLATVRARAPRATVWASPLDSYDGDISPVGEGDHVAGVRVVATPGHTPGHLALLDEDEGTLFTGDAIGSVDGRLDGGPPMFTADHDQARASLARLLAPGIGRWMFAHGPELPDTEAQLGALLSQPRADG